MLEADSSCTRCLSMGDKSGSIMGAGSAETAAAGRAAKTGATIFLTSGGLMLNEV